MNNIKEGCMKPKLLNFESESTEIYPVEKFPSKTLEKAVEVFSSLPGVGKKTALRYVLHLLKEDAGTIENFSEVLQNLSNNIQHCKNCFNISDNPVCEVCSNPKREQEVICIVQDIRDVLAIESTMQYKGVYHVLGGLISPIDSVGPNDIKINELIHRLQTSRINEVIMALSTTMEGDTTNFYLFKKIKDFPVKITTLARGVAFGDELEYTDEITLARSITNRVPYENTLAR
ncbi:Recombination protein RecR [Flavobacteriales bacterium]|nr:MAG: recombination protein RecR [Bacteroidota bacterium]CAG0953730.1 Recombination protein RecR [Flavobacteriales bacterium]